MMPEYEPLDGSDSRAVARVVEGADRWWVGQCDARALLGNFCAMERCHVVTDPPFSARVHGKQRRMLRGAGRSETSEVGAVDLGFARLSGRLQAHCAREFARIVQCGWVIVKADSDVTGPLRYSRLERAGAKRWGPCCWVKERAQPNLTGRGPAPGMEMLVTCSRGGPGWNAGGKIGVYVEPVATDINRTGSRFHTTQTPVGLWLQLLRDFTQPGDLIVDPFCGSASVGEACLRMGRRYLGCDFDAGDRAREACPEPYAVRARRRLETVEAEVAEHGQDPRRWMQAKQQALL